MDLSVLAAVARPPDVIDAKHDRHILMDKKANYRLYILHRC